MHNTDSPKFIQLPITEINSSDLIRQLSDDNRQLSDNIFQMRQIIDEMANTLAMQKELIQQLRDEIARLKGQKPKPDIKPSKLEGQNRKPDWHKRIGLHDGQRKTVLFSLWVYVESLEKLIFACFLLSNSHGNAYVANTFIRDFSVGQTR